MNPTDSGDPRVYVVASIADPTAPTAAELAAGRDITDALRLLDHEAGAHVADDGASG